MVGDKDWTLVRTPSAAAAGQISPQEQRDTFVRDQARGAVPLPGEPTPSTVGYKPTAAVPPRPEQQSQPLPTGVEERPDAGKPATPQPPPPVADAHEAELALQKGRDASRGLAQIAQGGAAAKNPIFQAAATPQVAMRNALIANFSPKTLQQPLAKNQPTPTRTVDQPATDKAVAAKTKMDAKDVRPNDTGETSSQAQLVAGKQLSPFAATSVRRETNSAKIATDGPTARAMDNVVTGRGVTAIATAQEFSAGGQGGFGDPDGDSAGLAQKVSTVAMPVAYGEDHDDTIALCNHLAWSGVVGGGESSERRIQASIGDRILNTQDDTPLGLRVQGSAQDHSQIAEGTRGSVLGQGRIVA